MTFDEAKQHQETLNKKVADTSSALQPFPKGPMGLVPDEVRATPEYKHAKQDFEKAFAELRAFNGWFNKTFKSEIRADRRARYSERLK